MGNTGTPAKKQAKEGGIEKEVTQDGGDTGGVNKDTGNKSMPVQTAQANTTAAVAESNAPEAQPSHETRSRALEITAAPPATLHATQVPEPMAAKPSQADKVHTESAETTPPNTQGKIPAGTSVYEPPQVTKANGKGIGEHMDSEERVKSAVKGALTNPSSSVAAKDVAEKTQLASEKRIQTYKDRIIHHDGG